MMKFMVCYDGSKASEAALNLARKHAALFDAEVFIVTALRQGPELDKIDIEKADGELEYLRTPFNIDEIPCETEVLVSYLSRGENLIQFAKENRIDQIFIGIRKKSKVGKLVFGSTSQYMILKAPCPVVTLK
jgi:nucleotide-binding universal stress UspA family protein